MLKFRKDYYECPMHRLVRAKTKECLSTTGEYSHEKVLEECNLKTLSEYIRWTYVYEEMALEENHDLMPVAYLFFTKDRYKQYITEAGDKVRKIDHEPGKFLPWGNGKTIAGYVKKENVPPILRETYLKIRQAQAMGQVESVSAIETRMIKNGLLPFQQNQLEEGSDDILDNLILDDGNDE